jgi:hypothetical protein
MSYGHGSAFGWPLWGTLLLMIPIAFVVGALTGHTPTWGFLQNPVALLGSLGVAALGNLWSLVHAEVLKGKPPTLRRHRSKPAQHHRPRRCRFARSPSHWIRIRRKLHAEIGL